MSKKQHILAIDPGTTQSAFVDFGDDSKILAKDIIPNEDILGIIEKTQAEIVVIEMVACYGMAVGKSIFETCLWIGRFIQKAISCGKQFKLIYRREVKMHLCNSVKAKDSNIRQALIDKLGEPGTKKNPGNTYGFKKDIWAALAVAVYWMENNKKGELK